MIAQGVWKVYKYQNRSQLSQASNQISCIRYIFFHQYHFPRLPWDGQIGDITTRSFCKNIVSWYKIGSKIQKRDTHPLLKLYFPHFISFIVPFTWRIHPHFFHFDNCNVNSTWTQVYLTILLSRNFHDIIWW